MPKCDFNKVALQGKTTLLKSHFGMGRTPFPKNASGGLLLVIIISDKSMKQFKGSFCLAVEQIQVFATNTNFVREMKFLSQHFEQTSSRFRFIDPFLH